MRQQKKLMRDWEHLSLEDGIHAGIESLSSAFRDGTPGARMSKFLDRD